MDIEFHADIYADEAIVRYRVAKDSPDGDEINLKQVERIDDIVGVQVLYLPTCACGCIVESWSMLDRRVYDALVNAGMLLAKIYEIEVELNGSYSRPPTVTFGGSWPTTPRVSLWTRRVQRSLLKGLPLRSVTDTNTDFK